jgi:hypothetical protein
MSKAPLLTARAALCPTGLSSTCAALHVVAVCVYADAGLHCEFERLRVLLDTTGSIHRKHRKLLRQQHAYVSHLLRLSAAIRDTCTTLRSELSVSSNKTLAQQEAVLDSRQHLAKLTARVELLRAAKEEIQRELESTNSIIAEIKA